MAARTVLSFGAGATLFGPLSKYLAEPAAEAWAKATEALPFLQPAGVTLEQSMQRLNDQLDAVLKARSPRDARARELRSKPRGNHAVINVVTGLNF